MSESDPTPPYIKYSNLAFQFVGFILIGYFGGKFLDNKFNAGNPPYFTAALILFLIFGFLYKTYRELTKSDE